MPAASSPDRCSSSTVACIRTEPTLAPSRDVNHVPDYRGRPVPEPSDSPLVTVDRSVDGVAVITLNRPERMNALSFALVDELHEALDAVHRDNDCRAVVLTGAGKGFC